MLYELNNDEKREQFAQVIDHLMQNGHKQKEIATRIGLTTYDISHLKSGALKEISSEVIDNLHEEFHINPNFIVKGATNMYDIPGIKYENFENFVDDWNLVNHESKSYLHFFMSENFYKFLIDVYNLKEASANSDDSPKMKAAFEKAFESLKENFSDSDNSKEFVLLPKDVMLKIIQDNIPKRQELGEIIDLLNLSPPKE